MSTPFSSILSAFYSTDDRINYSAEKIHPNATHAIPNFYTNKIREWLVRRSNTSLEPGNLGRKSKTSGLHFNIFWILNLEILIRTQELDLKYQNTPSPQKVESGPLAPSFSQRYRSQHSLHIFHLILLQTLLPIPSIKYHHQKIKTLAREIHQIQGL